MNSARKRRKPGKAAPVPLGAAAVKKPRPDAVSSSDFIDETLTVWQPIAKRRLTREDGRQIAENMAGFFRILQEWDRAERKAEKAPEPKRTEGSIAAPVPTP